MSLDPAATQPKTEGFAFDLLPPERFGMGGAYCSWGAVRAPRGDGRISG